MKKQLPSLQEIDAAICRASFYEFVKRSWPILFPNTTFVDGWHIRVLCTYLESTILGVTVGETVRKIQNLIINIPFRHMKSLLVTVFFPAWVWTFAPEKTFLCVSYSDTAEQDNSILCRKLIKSDWYTSRFAISLADDGDQKSSFTNTVGGYRKSFGFNGSIMGKGGDFVVVDDPHKATEIHSTAAREKVLRDYDEAVSTRLNDVKTGVRIVIMQRLASNDLTGHLLAKKDVQYEHLVLPAEYDGERFVSSLGIQDYRTEIGQPLWPEKFGPQELKSLKDSLGTEYAIASQLQQRPRPAGGLIFKKDWFSKRIPAWNCVARYISWDTASSTSADAARSACVIGDLLPDYRLAISFCYADKLEFPQLIYQMESIANRFSDGGKLNAIVVENKSSGISALQTLRQASQPRFANLLYPFNPPANVSKIQRQVLASKWCENGSVVLPEPSEDFPWLFDFEKEVFSSPTGDFLDIPDALSQLILYTEHLLSEGFRLRTKTFTDLMYRSS